jgi:hypothetical protein
MKRLFQAVLAAHEVRPVGDLATVVEADAWARAEARRLMDGAPGRPP